MLAMKEDFAIIIQRRLSRKKTLVVGKIINRRASLWVCQRRIPGLQITVGWAPGRLQRDSGFLPKCRGLHARSLSHMAGYTLSNNARSNQSFFTMNHLNASTMFGAGDDYSFSLGEPISSICACWYNFGDTAIVLVPELSRNPSIRPSILLILHPDRNSSCQRLSCDSVKSRRLVTPRNNSAGCGFLERVEYRRTD